PRPLTSTFVATLPVCAPAERSEAGSVRSTAALIAICLRGDNACRCSSRSEARSWPPAGSGEYSFKSNVAISGAMPLPQCSISARSFCSALARAVLGGFAGTVVFTLMMKFLAPHMISHPMDIAAVLGAFTGLGMFFGGAKEALAALIGQVVLGAIPGMV